MERVAPGEALAVEEHVKVPAPVAEVYRRWIDFSRFPEFMEPIQEVRPVGGGRYHWIGRHLDTQHEWDTEVTSQQEHQRIAWRSVTGPPQSATVTFQPLPNHQTEVRLRLEATPPEGIDRQQLDRLTHATHRSLKRSLHTFASLMRGERELGVAGMGRADLGPLATGLSLPTGAAILGGIASYVFLRPRYRAARRLGRRQRGMDAAERRAALFGWLVTMGTLGSILAAANERRRGQHTRAHIAGQVAPTLLGLGILARLLGQRTLKPALPGAIASWAFSSAAIGAGASSILAHLRGRRADGLFLGQWTPMLLAAAIMSRLFTRQ
jgi:uncharacterized protein YndB with AHSA1/START domain